MTTVLNRMLAIRANAAGPYKVTGPCHDCGETEGLVALPRPFAVSIAVCRRCRFHRTGIEDRRNLIQGEASIAGEQIDSRLKTDWKQPVALLPAAVEAPIGRPLPPEVVDEIFAPWDDRVDDPEHLGPDPAIDSES